MSRLIDNVLNTGPLNAMLKHGCAQLGTEDPNEVIRLVNSGSVRFARTKHTVDLAKSPRLPFRGAGVVKHDGKGIVEIELRPDDNLYIDGKKVVLHLSERQMGDKKVIGHELRAELEDGTQVLLNGNVLDYICDHPELFPEHWKKNEKGETLYISFWGSVFRCPSDGVLYVRRLCWWGGGELYQDYDRLDDTWSRLGPSASLTS